MKREVSLKRYSKIFILLGFMLVLTIIAPHSFPTIANLSNVLWSVSVIGIMVSGSIFAILVGGIDLSVGSMLALTGIIVVRIIRFFDYSVTGVLIGILAALLCGVLVGGGARYHHNKIQGACIPYYLCNPEHHIRYFHDTYQQ